MHPSLRTEAEPLIADRRAHAMALLSDAELARFHSDPRPERFLTGRMLLRELVAELTGADLASITIAASCADCAREHGQPRIVGHPEVHVSLSHAGGRTVAAATVSAATVSTATVGTAIVGTAIGVDIERRDASPERLAAILKIASGADLAHWTRVEAVLKADGRGLRVDPRAVEVIGDVATLEGVGYALTDASDDQYVISVATALAETAL